MTAMTTPTMKEITPNTIRAMFHGVKGPSQTEIQTGRLLTEQKSQGTIEDCYGQERTYEP